MIAVIGVTKTFNNWKKTDPADIEKLNPNCFGEKSSLSCNVKSVDTAAFPIKIGNANWTSVITNTVPNALRLNIRLRRSVPRTPCCFHHHDRTVQAVNNRHDQSRYHK